MRRAAEKAHLSNVMVVVSTIVVESWFARRYLSHTLGPLYWHKVQK
jgi:hypothetical protein